MKKKLPSLLPYRLIVGVLLWCVISMANARASASTDTIPKTAQRVYTGIYLMNLYDINISDHSFYADFYVWFKWKGNRDPTKIEFVNAIEKWGMTQTTFYDSTKLLANGYQYNGMRVEGRFYHPFDMARFPLDEHALAIAFEHAEYPYDSLVYMPDTSGKGAGILPAQIKNSKQQSALHPQFQLPGWDIEALRYSSQKNTYNTNFGDTDAPKTIYSNFNFTLDIARPLNYFWFKLLLPLLIVLIASLGGMFIFPSYVEARLSLPIGGLLTAVFLQQAYTDALPDVAYMVLMDKIYVLSYCFITLVLLQLIRDGNWYKTHKDAANITSLSRREYLLGTIYAVVYGLGLLWLIR